MPIHNMARAGVVLSRDRTGMREERVEMVVSETEICQRPGSSTFIFCNSHESSKKKSTDNLEFEGEQISPLDNVFISVILESNLYFEMLVYDALRTYL